MNPRTIALIPARSGSKGIKNKNLLTLKGKTLIEWAVDFATSHSAVMDTYISTDSVEYESLAIKSGAKSLGLRKQELSLDSSKTIDLALNFIQQLKDQSIQFEYLLLLQPTSPIRFKTELDSAIEIIEKYKSDAVVSVSEIEDPHPMKVKKIDAELNLTSFISHSDSETPRQALPKSYKLTGAYYLNRVESLIREKTFFPKSTKALVTKDRVNIDSLTDYEFAKFLFESDKIKQDGF